MHLSPDSPDFRSPPLPGTPAPGTGATAPAKTLPTQAVLALLVAVSAWLSGLALAPAAVAQGGGAGGDPRIALVELQRQGRWAEALQVVETLTAEDPNLASRWGLDLLVGDLEGRLGQTDRARQAYIDGMTRGGDLRAYSRYRLALEHARADHPEVAAGLVAAVVSGSAGTSTLPPVSAAVRLLREGIEAGGSCQLLIPLQFNSFDSAERRQLQLTRALCLERDGDLLEARGRYLALLDEARADEVALTAAQRLAELLRGLRFTNVKTNDEEQRLLGLTFHQHREFPLSVAYLAPQVAGFEGPLTGERFDLAYTLVRSRFWQERYAQAARGYAALAARAGQPRLTARALYQQGRCHELMREWPEAITTFRRAYRTDPTGNAADGALIGALRLEWLRGNEAAALELLELLAARREWNAVTARAAFFLAASDLVQGRSDRAGGWLDAAERNGGEGQGLELAYWRGRHAELEGDRSAALRRYLAVVRDDAYHPLAIDARQRLQQPTLQPLAESLAARRAGSRTPAGLYDAWLLRAAESEARRQVAHDLGRALAADPVTAPYVTLALVPTADWPLWSHRLATPEEKLLALGLWAGGEDALPDHFPIRNPSLGFTRSWLLARAGLLRDSLLVAELLDRRAPSRLPEPFLPVGLQRLLYPLGHPDLLVRESLGRGIDPFLLAAIVREESRFDATALSAASARGLTQFVLPTATQVARDIGLNPLQPSDLYRPEVALALGAAYLAQLEESFDGAQHPVVAAYNAGPHAARLWQSHCYSDELAEYYTKVTYRETRNYLRKVLSSWEHYRFIYGAPVTGQ